MKIRLMSVYVDDQDKALRFYTEVLGFAKKADFSQGPYRWLTVASPEEPDGTELQLAKNDNPAAKTYQQAMFQQGQPAAMFYTDDVKGDYERIKAHDAEFTTGLLLPGERKSVEPMAARLAPDNIRRMHQSLHHVVADAPCLDHCNAEGHLRQPHSARPAGALFTLRRRRCAEGRGGGRCRVWSGWKVSGRPHRTRPGVCSGCAVYAFGVGAGQEPLPPLPRKQTGRPPKLLRRDQDHLPLAVRELALGLPPAAWKTVNWRQGTRHKLRSRFAALRVRPAHRDYWQAEPHAEEWLLIEWPKGEAEPAKYWLSTLPAETKTRELVAVAKQRWIIERDYEELKQELGLGHYEGRGWRGFHHHATLCIAAYGFLVAERSRFPPSARAGKLDLCAPPLPPGFQPRGSSRPGRAA